VPPKLLTAVLLALAPIAPATAQTIIDDWANVKVPPPPELKSVTVDPKTYALLLLDFDGHDAANSGPCNRTTKPRCVAALPKVKAALEKARAKGVFVVYTVPPVWPNEDIWPEIAPAPGDPIVRAPTPNKFINSDLRALLEAKGIKTVIVTGTGSEGAVLNTAADAAFHGMNVVLPVDGMASTELYAEQYVAWHMTHAPGVAQKTTLTTLDRLGF
jgi:nicotinamidase-related amidase